MSRNRNRNRKAAVAEAAAAAQEPPSPPRAVPSIFVAFVILLSLAIQFIFSLIVAVFFLILPPLGSSAPFHFQSSLTSVLGSIHSINRTVEISRVLRILKRRNGYLRFCRVLESVLPSISYLESATIFAPIRFRMKSGINTSLDEFVKLHIVSGSYSFFSISLLVPNSGDVMWLTSMAGAGLKITRDFTVVADLGIQVNNVRFVHPDLISSGSMVVHGMTRSFGVQTHRKLLKMAKNNSAVSKEEEVNEQV